MWIRPSRTVSFCGSITRHFESLSIRVLVFSWWEYRSYRRTYSTACGTFSVSPQGFDSECSRYARRLSSWSNITPRWIFFFGKWVSCFLALFIGSMRFNMSEFGLSIYSAHEHNSFPPQVQSFIHFYFFLPLNDVGYVSIISFWCCIVCYHTSKLRWIR